MAVALASAEFVVVVLVVVVAVVVFTFLNPRPPLHPQAPCEGGKAGVARLTPNGAVPVPPHPGCLGSGGRVREGRGMGQDTKEGEK